MTASKRFLGFSLIEILIVLAIVSVLSMIAYASYTESVLRGRRAQARAALVALMQQQERYMTQNNCYLSFSTLDNGTATALAPSPAGACGGVTPSSVPFKTLSGDGSSQSSHKLSATVCPGSAGSGTSLSIAQCVKLVATPLGADPAVGNLELTSLGSRSCTGTAASTKPRLCWP